MKSVKILAIMIILILSTAVFATLTAKFTIIISSQNQKTVGLTTVKDDLGANWSIEFANGTGANEADKIWHNSGSLATGLDETLDIHDGTLKDAFGTALTLNKLKLLAIYNTSSDPNLLIGGAETTPLGLFAGVTDILKLPPGGKFIYSAPNINGLDVTTNSDLKLTHDGTGSSNLIYQIIVVGVD